MKTNIYFVCLKNWVNDLDNINAYQNMLTDHPPSKKKKKKKIISLIASISLEFEW